MVRMRSSSGGSLSTGVVWDRHTGCVDVYIRELDARGA